MAREKVLVLGAGLQGACAALLLTRRGHRVTLVDRAPEFMLRASLRNEGKIHLGFVYANDPSFATSLLMLRAALAFGPALEECLGRPIDWRALVSRPFSYVVPHDSMVPPAELRVRYHQLDQAFAELAAREPGGYLGTRPASLLREGARAAPFVASDRLADTVDTVELALDLPALRDLLAPVLAASVDLRCGRTALEIARTAAGFRVSGVDARGAPWREDAGLVVNCLWDGRLALDRQLGLVPERRWVYRLKYRLLGTLPRRLADLPSLTVVLGRYGDVVVYPEDRVYVSWYPACMRGWSTDLAPPAEWEAPCAGRVDPELAGALQADALAEFARLIPGLDESRIDTVDAGVIFSWGQSDIDDPASELHRRHDVGVRAEGGYFSVDTGKLTCAPLFARELAAAVARA